jgi:tRNA nucleotidyltransferase (CCA-adding enzyme)
MRPMAGPVSPPGYLDGFEARLSAHERKLVGAVRSWCEQHGAPLYLVGGSVRDLLLRRPHLDVDLAVEGDAAALARDCAAALGGTATTHEQFGTATVAGAGWSFDVARTRSERYFYPGALPEVTPASIEGDLARRDFTIHAMALALNGTTAGALLDPFGGGADIEARVLRVLHANSFRDDPTRILRLARYAARLDAAIAPDTAALARRDATFLGMVSPARVSHEIERTLAEALPEKAIGVLADLRALAEVLPPLRDVEALGAAFARLRRDGGGPPGPTEYLCAAAGSLPRPQIQSLASRLESRRNLGEALYELPAAVQALRSLGTAAPDPVLVMDRLGQLSLAAVRGAGAASGDGPALLVRRYLNEWRSVRPSLRGDDLIQLGVPEGPAIGAALRRLRDARLRGEVSTAEGERAHISSWLAREAGAGSA